MPEGRQELRSKVVVEGADAASKDFGKVAAAQAGVTGKTTEAAKETAKLTEATEKLRTSESDVVGLLTDD